ncbi:hypothetical protein [Catellatospora sichuanensis]|uniref:hypothetical protein n=1 Tax=Catellatospora sichuanensis TaxID=1969805 RepID=UPI00118233A1|nr:hypothetical protein [Catellatospora sichuanensis]
MATMVGCSLRLSARNPDALFMAVILPVVLILLFVCVFGRAINTGHAYINYVVPGIIILCAGLGASTASAAHDLRAMIEVQGPAQVQPEAVFACGTRDPMSVGGGRMVPWLMTWS